MQMANCDYFVLDSIRRSGGGHITYRAICEMIWQNHSISVQRRSVERSVKRLEKNGYIARTGGRGHKTGYQFTVKK